MEVNPAVADLRARAMIVVRPVLHVVGEGTAVGDVLLGPVDVLDFYVAAVSMTVQSAWKRLRAVFASPAVQGWRRGGLVCHGRVDDHYRK